MEQNKDAITNEKKGKNYRVVISAGKACSQQTNEGKRRLTRFLIELAKDKSI